jgi:hypothetical protein
VVEVMIGVDPHKGSHTAFALDASEAKLSQDNHIAMRRLPDPTALVRRHAEPGTGWVWKLSQQMVHGHNQAHSHRFDTDGMNSYRYEVRPAAADEIAMPVAWACGSLVMGREAMTAILGWPSVGDLFEKASEAIIAVSEAEDGTSTSPQSCE